MPDESPDLPAGSRAEPADIVYADSHGHFAKFLETQDCVGLEGWLSTPPAPKRKYFIEVKTTTQGCDAVFHMSKGQYSRVSTMSYLLSTMMLTKTSDARNAEKELHPSGRRLYSLSSL